MEFLTQTLCLLLVWSDIFMIQGSRIYVSGKVYIFLTYALHFDKELHVIYLDFSIIVSYVIISIFKFLIVFVWVIPSSFLFSDKSYVHFLQRGTSHFHCPISLPSTLGFFHLYCFLYSARLGLYFFLFLVSWLAHPLRLFFLMCKFLFWA